VLDPQWRLLPERSMTSLALPVPTDLRPWVLALRVDDLPSARFSHFPARVEAGLSVLLHGSAWAVTPEGAQPIPPASLSGAQTQPTVTVTRGPVTVLWALLHPAAVAPLSALPAAALTDQTVPLETLGGTLWVDTEARLRAQCGPQAQVAVLVDWLRLRLQPARSRVAAGRALAMATLASDGQVGVRALAEALGCSERQLERCAINELGLSPRAFMRIRRFETTLRHALSRGEPTLARLAAAGGYYDQAHMARDFTSLAGESPGRWLQRLHGDHPEHWAVLRNWRQALGRPDGQIAD